MIILKILFVLLICEVLTYLNILFMIKWNSDLFYDLYVDHLYKYKYFKKMKK